MNPIVQAVREHAEDCYNQGWDTIVECWGDDDIAGAIGDARTPHEAIDKIARMFRLSAVKLTGWIVKTEDVDGCSINSFPTRDAAAHYFEEMSGRAPRGDDDYAVSDFGTAVSFHEA